MQLTLRTLVLWFSLLRSTGQLGPYPAHLCLMLPAKINAELCPFSEANLEADRIARGEGGGREGEGRESGGGAEREGGKK